MALKDLAERDERSAYRARQFSTALTAAVPTAEHDQLLLDIRRAADQRQNIGSDTLATLLNTLVRTARVDEES